MKKLIKQYATLIILASASPRRTELIQRINLPMRSFGVDIDESPFPNEKPKTYVRRMSSSKLIQAVYKLKNFHKPTLVLACDTIVVHDDEIMLKPHTRKEAKATLIKLSGNHHFVFTAVSMKFFDQQNILFNETFVEKTKVFFYELSEEIINTYLDSNSWKDKAGSYGIQDSISSLFIRKIHGNYENVMGLPISRIYQHLVSARIIQ